MKYKTSAAAMLAAVLAAGGASANVVFDFSGALAGGGPATGVLTLSDAYTPGTPITTADFISFSYNSTDQAYNLVDAPDVELMGGLNANGSFISTAGVRFQATDIKFPEFAANAGGGFSSQTGLSIDSGSDFSFTEVSSGVPEPAAWALMLAGFAGLGTMLRARGKRVNAYV